MCPPIVHTLWQELALVREQRHYKLQYSAIPFPSCCQHKCPTLRLHHDWTFWHQQPIKLNWLKDKIQAWLMTEIKLLFFFFVFFSEQFQFISQRHRGYPFSATLYVNGIMVGRISSCCEYRYAPGFQQGKKSCFRLMWQAGGLPCYRLGFISKGGAGNGGKIKNPLLSKLDQWIWFIISGKKFKGDTVWRERRM